MSPSVVVVTGGAGFIGSTLIRHLLASTDAKVVNVDKLTYAANPAAIAEFERCARYQFVKACVTDRDALRSVFALHHPDAIIHLAAESHVDRSIDNPLDFIQTNIVGTFVLLEATREYLSSLSSEARRGFRFHHVSTDEVFGSLGPHGRFTEATSYSPNSPYSASKASSDHLVRAWHATYGVPVVLSNCSNNYGPWQFPEKLVPLAIVNALKREPLPVYGKGEQIRDWLYVDDHAHALHLVLTRGRLGESYNVGGNSERTNIEVVESICDLIDAMAPEPGKLRRRELITFVRDRPAHDKRYAMDSSKITNELGWHPQETVASGLAKTVRWYLENAAWWRAIPASRRQRIGLVEALL